MLCCVADNPWNSMVGPALFDQASLERDDPAGRKGQKKPGNDPKTTNKMPGKSQREAKPGINIVGKSS
jgi:hypothetical protein